MKFFAILFAIVGAASAVAPVLLPKVNIAPTQVNVVRQPIAVTQPELVYRNVPVPVRAVAYTNPVVSQPIIHAAPVAVATPAIAAHSIASPVGIASPLGLSSHIGLASPLAHGLAW